MENVLTSSIVLKKLTQLLIVHGKKRIICKKVTQALQYFNKKKTVYKNLCTLTGSLYRIKPLLETVSVRKGSKFYEVPVFIKVSRQNSIMLKWVVISIKRKNSSLENNIVNEFKDLLKNQGSAVQNFQSLRKKISSNIRYSHYRWR